VENWVENPRKRPKFEEGRALAEKKPGCYQEAIFTAIPITAFLFICHFKMERKWKSELN
jgi:hypothetical protein